MSDLPDKPFSRFSLSIYLLICSGLPRPLRLSPPE